MHDGFIATVRPTLPQDAPFEVALAKELSSGSRYACFLVGGGRLTDEMLTVYAQIDYVNHMALVVGVTRLNDTGEDLIADSRFAVEDSVTEFTMLVAGAWQGKGMGRRLFTTLMRTVRVSGAREIFGEVLSINRRMISLARDTDSRVADVPGDATVCTIRLPLAQAKMAVTPFAFA